MRKILVFLALTLITLAGSLYYFYGPSERFLTRSYFLEKRLRHLLFLETHEPVNYAGVLADYKGLLDKIRFGAKTNRAAIYRRAVARTETTIQIIFHLRQYNSTQSEAELLKAHELYRQVFVQGLNEYEFYIFYLNNERVTDEWFRDEMQKPKSNHLSK